MPEFITHGPDRTSIAFGLEVRVPFLDHELVEFCSRIPPTLKMRGFREKYILREALRGVLPEEIRTRKSVPSALLSNIGGGELSHNLQKIRCRSAVCAKRDIFSQHL